jgi:dihydrofolate reductase
MSSRPLNGRCGQRGSARDLTDEAGALVSGRRLFDIANGWNDTHPAGISVVVVTHNPPDDAAKRWPKTTFVDGVERAIVKAREIARDKNVTNASPNVIAQALELGLVDEIGVSLVPVLFGEGIPYFSKLDRQHLLLEDPVVVQGRRALRLRYRDVARHVEDVPPEEIEKRAAATMPAA